MEVAMQITALMLSRCRRRPEELARSWRFRISAFFRRDLYRPGLELKRRQRHWFKVGAGSGKALRAGRRTR